MSWDRLHGPSDDPERMWMALDLDDSRVGCYSFLVNIASKIPFVVDDLNF